MNNRNNRKARGLPVLKKKRKSEGDAAPERRKRRQSTKSLEERGQELASVRAERSREPSQILIRLGSSELERNERSEKRVEDNNDNDDDLDHDRDRDQEQEQEREQERGQGVDDFELERSDVDGEFGSVDEDGDGDEDEVFLSSAEDNSQQQNPIADWTKEDEEEILSFMDYREPLGDPEMGTNRFDRKGNRIPPPPPPSRSRTVSGR